MSLALIYQVVQLSTSELHNLEYPTCASQTYQVVQLGK